jgi:hypothetical protein
MLRATIGTRERASFNEDDPSSNARFKIALQRKSVARIPRKNNGNEGSVGVGGATENADVDKKNENSPGARGTSDGGVRAGDYNAAISRFAYPRHAYPGPIENKPETIKQYTPRIESTLGKYIENTRE